MLPSVLLIPTIAMGQPQMVWENTISVTSELIEGGRDMVVDDEGNAIVLGGLAVEQDFFVLKFDPSGDLLWDMIIGGSALDNASDLEVDGAGDIYIAGRSLSDDFPAVNAYQATKSGPSDAFLMKLDGDDGSILFSTYFGGTRAEWAHGIALGADGRITIVGDTDSINLETVNPIQEDLTLLECFCQDFFVTQFSPAADEVLFSTYLGGTFDEYSKDVSVDASGNIYVAGRTRSEDFPTQNAQRSARIIH
jgi:outer membrane protein assembly factor BamB